MAGKAHQNVSFRRVIHIIESLSGFMGPECRCSECLHILRRERHINQNKRSVIRNQDQTTCCFHKIEKRKLVDNKLVLVTDVVWLSCTEICEPAFLECSVERTRKSINLPLLSTGTFLGAGKSINWLFPPSAWKLEASFDQLCLRNFLDC